MRTNSENSSTMSKAETFESYVSQKKSKKKGLEKILEEIIVENFHKMGKKIATQVQETQGVPNRINTRLNTPVQFRSVTLSCPALCHPMGSIRPSLPVHHKLLEIAQTYVH